MPTFVVGTQGDDASDREVRSQVTFIRGLFFPDAPVVEDTAVQAEKGPFAWPARPVVYGGPHVVSALRAVGESLPFELEPGRLTVGGETFRGDDVLLITVVPAGPKTPEMLVYAGTGKPGVAEINAVGGGGRDPLLVADRFGVLARGVWVQKDGRIVGELGARAPRCTFRTTERPFRGTVLRIASPTSEAEPEDAYVRAISRGLERAASRLGVEPTRPIDAFVYADAAAKKRCTGNAGDGHTVPSSQTLHVRRADPAEGGSLEGLVAHEGTHLLAAAAWGTPGTPAMGEGLAVWVSGRYRGVTVDDWRKRGVARPPLSVLLGKGFLSLPEEQSYPTSAILVDDAVKRIGLEGFRAHLYGATGGTWSRACAAAGVEALGGG